MVETIMPDTAQANPLDTIWAAIDDLRDKVEELRVNEAREGAVMDRLLLMEPKIDELTKQVSRLHTKFAVHDVKLYALVGILSMITSGVVAAIVKMFSG